MKKRIKCPRMSSTKGSNLLGLVARRLVPVHNPRDIVACIVNTASNSFKTAEAVVEIMRRRLIGFEPEQASHVLLACHRESLVLPEDIVTDLRECLVQGPLRMEPLQFIRALEILNRMQGPRWDPLTIPTQTISRLTEISSAHSLLKLCRMGFAGVSSRILERALSLLKAGDLQLSQRCELAFFLNESSFLPSFSISQGIPSLAVPFSLAYCVAWNQEELFHVVMRHLPRAISSLASRQAQLVLWTLLSRGDTVDGPLINRLRLLANLDGWACVQTKNMCLSALDEEFELPYPLRIPSRMGLDRHHNLIQALGKSIPQNCGISVRCNQVMDGKFFVDLLVNESTPVVICLDEMDPFFRIHSRFLPPKVRVVSAQALGNGYTFPNTIFSSSMVS